MEFRKKFDLVSHHAHSERLVNRHHHYYHHVDCTDSFDSLSYHSSQSAIVLVRSSTRHQIGFYYALGNVIQSKPILLGTIYNQTQQHRIPTTKHTNMELSKNKYSSCLFDLIFYFIGVPILFTVFQFL